MIFYGLQKTTLIDFPDIIACVLFTKGCNLRCPFCHNPELVLENIQINPISWEEIFSFLQKRKNVLEGVCISGGEPLLHNEIFYIIEEIKKIGLKVKIDTNGTFPDKLIKLNVDYIAMDIKTSFEKYKLCNPQNNNDIINKIKESINWLIQQKSIDYEFRTTVVPEIVTINDIKEIVKFIKGAKKYNLNQFSPKITLNPEFKLIKAYDITILKEMQKIILNNGINCEINS